MSASKIKLALRRKRRRPPSEFSLTPKDINAHTSMSIRLLLQDELNKDRNSNSNINHQATRGQLGSNRQLDLVVAQRSHNKHQISIDLIKKKQVKKEQQEMQVIQVQEAVAQQKRWQPHTLVALAIVLLVCAYDQYPRVFQLVSCQTSNMFLATGAPSVDQIESRAETALGPSNLLHNNNKPQQPNNIALNQLVNFLNSINNQNQNNAANGQGRRSAQALPLGSMGNQRVSLPQPISSTPVNPFVAAVQFQPTRRQQYQPPLQQNLNFAPSSSPPTLTLNRIANQFVSAPTSGLAPTRFGNNQNQLQPINTIPLSSFANSNQTPNRAQISSPRGASASGLQTRTQVQFPPATSQQQSASSQRSPLLPPSIAQSPPLRPIISGFAPSGPPPNSANNNAISVVQSPPNAVGQPESTSTTSKITSESDTTRQAMPTTTTTAATTITTPSQTNSINTTTSATSEPTLTMISSSEFQSQSQSPSSTTTVSTTSSTAKDSQAPTDSIASIESSSSTNAWNPVNNRTTQQQQRQSNRPSLAPSPDIVTVPPNYNPDQPQTVPQSYDISVSAQMGSLGSSSLSGQRLNINNTRPLDSILETLSSSFVSPQSVQETPTLATVQPTISSETTTIFWSDERASSTSVVPQLATRLQPTRTSQVALMTTPTTTSTSPTLTTTVGPVNNSSVGQVPSRIRDNSMVQSSDEPPPAESQDAGVVYGKAASRDAKPTRPDQSAGRPFIQTAQLDTQVRPFSAGTLAKSNHGATSGHQLPFKPSRPLNGGGVSSTNGGGGGMSVGSGFTIVASGNQTMPVGDIQDYVAGAPPPIVPAASTSTNVNSNTNEPTISAQGGPDPASFELAGGDSARGSSGSTTTSSPPVSRLRRPTFKPKPAVPPIRIDSCIVGDDSSCDQSHNERCVTEYGISSCHCKPGFARLSQLRGYCSPISLLQFNLKIDRLSDDRRLAFNQTLENPNSEEYQYLEFETVQALASAIQQTPLAKQFMGVRVNKFQERKGKVWANLSLSLESSNSTRSEARVQQLVGHELAKLVQSRQRQPLGESTLVLDGAKESISKLIDVNECSSKELNDCSKHATCSNEFGGFSCQCLAGFEDKYLQQQQQQQQQQQNSQEQNSTSIDKSKVGRLCMGCSAAYCSNRGECSIVEGKKQCKCRPNFMGARCDIDSEVLFVALGGTLVGLIILLITFWCLFVFNRRWRREQQKMDAMSATSGLTYNYVNSSNSSNSLMSPAARMGVAAGPLGRSSANAAAYGVMGHRLGGGNGGVSARQFGGNVAADKQAIIGSTSSGSSAASQPIACIPYAAGYQYEDAGLLIAPASTSSSEQTSPGASSFRGHNQSARSFLAATTGGNAYTLSGHHHHHHLNHHLQAQQHAMHQHHAHLHNKQQQQQLASQFHPAMAEYARTLNASANYQPQLVAANGYDTRWRTMQDNKQQQSLAGYYVVR